MKAMIFAAGLGTRLKPITDTLPKALVPVGGRPLIDHVCRRLADSGISEGVVNIHHFADKVEEWVRTQDIMTLEVSDERQQLLETGGAVLHARRLLEGCGSFLVHNVDILSNADLRWLASQVRPESLATLLVSRRESSRFFLFDPQTMRLVGWKNSLTGECIMADEGICADRCLQFAFSGIHVLSDRVFAIMDEYVKEKSLPSDSLRGVRFPIRDFYLWAARKHAIYGTVAENLELIDVGKLDTLEKAEKFLGI